MDIRARTRQWRLRNNQTARILDNVELFSECTVKQLRLVAQLMCPISVKSDWVIVHAGDPCRQLVVVLSGEAGSSTPDGDEGCLGPGSLFGEQALLPGSVEIATVTATTSMEILVSSRVELSRMIQVAPSIEWNLLANVARQSPALQPAVVDAGIPRLEHVVLTT
jgi:CRP-like cAMP-binding protein